MWCLVLFLVIGFIVYLLFVCQGCVGFLTRSSQMSFLIQHYNADLDLILAFSPNFWNFRSTKFDKGVKNINKIEKNTQFKTH